MKFFFLLLLFSIGFSAFAQQPQIKIDTSNWLGKKKLDLKPVSLDLLKVYPQARLSHILPNGNKVYKLPQDNMPCIVPDSSLYSYRMPVFRGDVTGNMPNASPRMQLIPQKKN